MQRIKNCKRKILFPKKETETESFELEKIAKRLMKRIIFLSFWLIFWSCTQSIPCSTKHRHTFSTDPGIRRNESKRSIARKSKRAAPPTSGQNFGKQFPLVLFHRCIQSALSISQIKDHPRRLAARNTNRKNYSEISVWRQRFEIRLFSVRD